MSDPLKEATEKLNAVLLDAEKAFIDLDLGVTASVPLFTSNETLRLCFGKNGNEWGLYIVSGVNAENWTPLRNSSRRLRVESTLWLTSLRDALVKASQTSTEEVNEATLRAVEAVKQIRGG